MDNRILSRRTFLRSVAGGAAALAVGNQLSRIYAQDPTATPLPLPQGSAGKLTLIHKTEYFEQVQTMFRDEVTNFAAANGIELDVSTANPELFGDFLAAMLAAVQAGNPPDLAYHVLSIPQMYALDILEDVSDVVEQVLAMHGDVVPINAEFNAKIDGKWWAVPYMSTVGAWMARHDVFEAAGIDVATLDTWDARRDAALAVSDPDNDMWGWGLTINRSGDGHGLIMSVIHSFGGSIAGEDGMQVVFNSPETVAAVEWLAETYTSDKYKPMLPPGVESWTDTNNNEAYLAGVVAMTLNQLSVYGAAKANDNPVFENTTLLHAPKALDGRILEAGQNGWFTIFKGAQNVDAAKELILHMLTPGVFTPMAQAGGGLFNPAYKGLFSEDYFSADPNFDVLGEILFNPDLYYGNSHPAPPNALADSIIAAAIPSQMMANVTNGSMSAAEAVEDAHRQIVQIYEEAGAPQ